MNLSEIRTQFIDMSGRADFSADATGIARANWFINAGSRLLDGMIEKPDSETYRFELAAGKTLFTLRSLRYASEVTRTDANGQEIKLVKASNYEVRTGKIWDGWSYAPSGSDPMRRGERPNSWFVPAGDGYAMANIEVSPWAETSTVTVVGRFDSGGMSADTDTNWWSMVRPELLVKAALYQLETFYRNSSGAADWLAAIQLEITGVDHDAAARDLSGDMALGG